MLLLFVSLQVDGPINRENWGGGGGDYKGTAGDLQTVYLWGFTTRYSTVYHSSHFTTVSLSFPIIYRKSAMITEGFKPLSEDFSKISLEALNVIRRPFKHFWIFSKFSEDSSKEDRMRRRFNSRPNTNQSYTHRPQIQFSRTYLYHKQTNINKDKLQRKKYGEKHLIDTAEYETALQSSYWLYSLCYRIRQN